MIDKYQIFDIYLQSVCRLNKWEISEVDFHIKEIESITKNLIPTIQHKLEQMPPENKKHLIASRIIATLDDDDVFIEMIFRTALLVASDTWDEYTVLLNKFSKNSPMNIDSNHLINFDEMVKKFLNRKQE